MRRLLAAWIALCVAQTTFAQPRPVDSTKDQSSSDPVEAPISEKLELTEAESELIRNMPLKKKVGQLLMIGFMGDTIGRGLGQTMKSVFPGAIVVFGRNITSARQVSNLNLSAQELSIKLTGVPLLIGVDQEGGDVIRIKTAYPLPSALALGEAGRPDIVEAAGEATGELLRTLGFNMNLAPVLDVGDPNVPSFIGTRTYGRDPKIVAKMGYGFGLGLARAKILPTAKHFPGHGGISEDSHRVAPEKGGSPESLLRNDAIPFQYVAKEAKGPWAYMLAHVSYPSLDPTRMPATFSKPIVQDLLRDKLGFDGIVLTDDIEMAGAHVITDARERAIRAIEAGADMVMMAWNKRLQTQVSDALLKAVRSGRLPEERVNDSLRRIILAKRIYASSPRVRPTTEKLRTALQNQEFKRVAEATMTAILERPLDTQEREFVAFSQGKPVFLFSANQKFAGSFKSSVGTQPVRFYPLVPGDEPNVDKIMRANPNAVGIYYLSAPHHSKLANRISEDVARRILVVTVEPQGLLKKPGSFRHVAEIYYRHPNLGKLIAEHFFRQTAFDTSVEVRSPATSSPKAKADDDEKNAEPEDGDKGIENQFDGASSISPTSGARKRIAKRVRSNS